jgi:formate dehydrogenase major subunit
MAVKQIQSTCAYCGAGCQIMFTVDQEANKILEAVPAQGRTNDGTLCLKGHYGWDYINDPQILTKRLKTPMIRKGGKDSPLEPVDWDEAIGYVAGRLQAIKDKWGPDSIMCTGSARGPGNEANYIMQKFARAAIGTNNVDHCARI